MVFLNLPLETHKWNSDPKCQEFSTELKPAGQGFSKQMHPVNDNVSGRSRCTVGLNSALFTPVWHLALLEWLLALSASQLAYPHHLQPKNKLSSTPTFCLDTVTSNCDT